MFISDYDYKDENWSFNIENLSKLNLIIGISGIGKTKFLNSLFGMAKNAVTNEIKLTGDWKCKFYIGNTYYLWELKTIWINDKSKVIVKKERLIQQDNEIINRNNKNIIYNGSKLIQLPQNISSIALLRNEENIKPIYNGFSAMMRRDFSRDELNTNYIIESLPTISDSILKIKKDTKHIFFNNFSINTKAYLLNKYHDKKFRTLRNRLLQIFDYISDFFIKDISKIPEIRISVNLPTPILCLKEKNINKTITSPDFSSGIKKVILILIDLLVIPKEGTYLIDEYENSLGSNIIDFLPKYIMDNDIRNQLFVTTHNPYIINNFPIESWLLFSRKGSIVKGISGNKLKEKYGKSKHNHFSQLLNDPLYKNGIE